MVFILQSILLYCTPSGSMSSMGMKGKTRAAVRLKEQQYGHITALLDLSGQERPAQDDEEGLLCVTPRASPRRDSRREGIC